MPHSKKDDFLWWIARKSLWANVIRQCYLCQFHGYDPSKLESVESRHLRRDISKWFSPMEFDELGRCEQCRNASELPPSNT
jgi:hypothetical protein